LVYSVSETALSGTIRLQCTGECATLDTAIYITVKPLPYHIDSIIGPKAVEKGMDNVIYRVAHVADGLIYQWTLPTGFIGQSTADSILVLISNDAVNGSIKVRQITDCAAGEECMLDVTVLSLELTPGLYIVGVITAEGCQYKKVIRK